MSQKRVVGWNGTTDRAPSDGRSIQGIKGTPKYQPLKISRKNLGPLGDTINAKQKILDGSELAYFP